MKFIEVKCVNREATVNINIDHIVLLNKMTVAGSGKEACQIVLTSTNDNKGPVVVIKSVSDIKKQINAAKLKVNISIWPTTGLTKKVMSIEDIANLAPIESPKKRGGYKKIIKN